LLPAAIAPVLDGFGVGWGGVKEGLSWGAIGGGHKKTAGAGASGVGAIAAIAQWLSKNA